MKNPIRTGALSIGLSLVMLASCQGSGAFAQVQQNLAEIKQNQEKILAKLDTIEQKAAAAPARPGPDRAQQRPQGPDPKVVYKADVGDAYVKGPADAKITIVQWSDFQCPFCKRVEPTMDQIMKAYGNDVRIAFKHNALPMHPRALPAALAAEAAGKQGKFWEMHAKLFENNKDLTDENFVKWAEEIGLDVNKFKKDLEDPALKAKADAQQKQGTGLGARGTPAFFINGRYLSGAQPFEAFKALIDEEMKKADEMIAKGTPRDQVYETIMKTAKAS